MDASFVLKKSCNAIATALYVPADGAKFNSPTAKTNTYWEVLKRTILSGLVALKQSAFVQQRCEMCQIRGKKKQNIQKMYLHRSVPRYSFLLLKGGTFASLENREMLLYTFRRPSADKLSQQGCWRACQLERMSGSSSCFTLSFSHIASDLLSNLPS